MFSEHEEGLAHPPSPVLTWGLGDEPNNGLGKVRVGHCAPIAFTVNPVLGIHWQDGSDTGCGITVLGALLGCRAHKLLVLLGPCHSDVILTLQVYHQTGELGGPLFIQVQGAGWDQIGSHTPLLIVCEREEGLL